MNVCNILIGMRRIHVDNLLNLRVKDTLGNKRFIPSIRDLSLSNTWRDLPIPWRSDVSCSVTNSVAELYYIYQSLKFLSFDIRLGIIGANCSECFNELSYRVIPCIACTQTKGLGKMEPYLCRIPLLMVNNPCHVAQPSFHSYFTCIPIHCLCKLYTGTSVNDIYICGMS